MRRSSALIVALILGLTFLPAPIRACPWFPPTDPCLPDGWIEGSVSEDEEPEPESEPDLDTGLLLMEREPEPAPLPCEDVCRSLKAPDQESRRGILERVAHFSTDLECACTVAELGPALRAEPDATLVYRVLIAMGSGGRPDDDEHPALAGLLDHPSPDVRWFAAELLSSTQVEDPRVAGKVVAALRAEREPWIRLALARASLDPYTTEARAALIQLVQEEGPVSPFALQALAGDGESVDVLLDSLGRSPLLRAIALDLLRTRGQDKAVQNALLQVVQHGSDTE